MRENLEKVPTRKKEGLFLEALSKKQVLRPPFWLMRQAGRYLPEYRALRAKAGSFLDLCFNPEMASEVTLQPVKRFGVDAAILFSDILVIPYALGQSLSFQEGEGPKLGSFDISSLEKKLPFIEKNLSSVFETIDRTKNNLPEETALIGFAGSPWTIACYMINGGSSRDFKKANNFALEKPDYFSRLMEIITFSTIDYLSAQIKAGVDAVQLFDSWAGLAENFENQVINPTQKIVAELKKRHPEIPIIGFARKAGDNYSSYAKKTKVDAIGVDQDISLEKMKGWQKICAVQGNLDPELLLKGGDVMKSAVLEILETLSKGPFIFNLGHGVIKETPPEHVALLSEIIRNWKNV